MLKEFCTILLGQQLRVYTDHKNLNCKNFNIIRVLRWGLILEKYGPEIQYIPGTKNIIADAMPRIPSNGKPNSTHKSNYITETLLEIYDVKELTNGTFPLKFTTINHYQQEDPGIKSKLISAK